MPSDYDNQLLRAAILSMKSKDYLSARHYLERALEMADDRETHIQANFYLSQVTDDPVQKRKHLEETLAFDPTHAQARKALATLQGKFKSEEMVDPDRLPASSSETQKAKAERFTCPKCGSRMVFDGDGRTLMCESCRREEEVLGGVVSAEEQDFIISMATGQGQRKPVAMRTFNCQGCGAAFLLPPQVISESCSYCGSVHVVIGTRELVEPDSIIPMAFKQREAALRLVKWIEKHKITPKGQVQAPRGIYLPIWTFDIAGSVSWHGLQHRDKSMYPGEQLHTALHPEPVSGDKMASFDDILIPATSKLGDLFQKAFQDFVFSGAVAYNRRYLAGWPAEIYETPMAAASLQAREKAVRSIRELMKDDIAGVSNVGYSTAHLSVVSFKLVLVPVWVTEYAFEGDRFRVLINGQNGKIYGETPSRGILDWIEDIFGG